MAERLSDIRGAFDGNRETSFTRVPAELDGSRK
jgi:hypothetical protein